MHKTLPKMVKKEESSREISVNINQTYRQAQTLVIPRMYDEYTYIPTTSH